MYNYNKVYKSIIGVGVSMTRIVKSAIQSVFCHASSMPDLWPNTDYQKHVPKSARELAEVNWKRTGDSLQKAMKCVGEENDSKK